jgi:hypothetical protein
MSHVDEGTLHAYLDGELAPVERERVDTHLKGCPACQARLAEERALIERASRLLGMATPPERAMPPLSQLRRPPVFWRLRRPLAWAATLILAVGLGWYVRGTLADRTAPPREEADQALASKPASAPSAPPAAGLMQDSPSPVAQPKGHLAMRHAGQKADSVNKDRDVVQRELESAAVETGAMAGNAVAARESASVATLGAQTAKTAAELPRPAASGVTVRRQTATAPAVAAAPEPQVQIDGSLSRASLYGSGESRRRATPVMSTTWPIIARQPARDVLGVEPVIIPGFAVRAYRRNPQAREIVVEQVTDAGTTISLIERRMDPNGYADELRMDSAAANAPQAMAKAANERLARFVGLLRVEIDGPLTPDSLSSLLELAR